VVKEAVKNTLPEDQGSGVRKGRVRHCKQAIWSRGNRRACTGGGEVAAYRKEKTKLTKGWCKKKGDSREAKSRKGGEKTTGGTREQP